MKRQKNKECSCNYKQRGGMLPINSNHMNPENSKGWIRAVKKPVPQFFKKMESDFWVETLEGKICGRAGDYLAIGTHGEKYIIREHIFKDSYSVLT